MLDQPLPDTAAVDDLVAQLEGATEGSRELDAAIVKTLYPQSSVAPYCLGDDEPVVFHAEPLVRNKRELPAFTTDIGAALTLVPEGHKWACGFSKFVPHNAQVWPTSYSTGYFSGECDSNRAIALCIASLKARARIAGAAS